jgi:hypothetical protein
MALDHFSFHYAFYAAHMKASRSALKVTVISRDTQAAIGAHAGMLVPHVRPSALAIAAHIIGGLFFMPNGLW